MHIKITDDDYTENLRQKVISDAQKQSAAEILGIAIQARKNAEEDRKEFREAFVTILASLFYPKGSDNGSSEDNTRSK